MSVAKELKSYGSGSRAAVCRGAGAAVREESGFAEARTSARSTSLAPAARRYGAGQFVNDIHSQLNETRVGDIVEPDSVAALQALMRRARDEGRAVSVAGGRHAMGGQQFAGGDTLVDMRRMNRVLSFNPSGYEIEVEAGIQWPELINFMVGSQRGLETSRQASIVQKQTGADNLTIGGALAANIHGRGLNLKPFIDDVESFVLVDAEGEARACSRLENRELFRLAVGGYGLFGIIASVRLRLARRRKLERVAEISNSREVMGAFESRIADGFLYGDFQFAIDDASTDFLRRGVFSCYRPVADETFMPDKGVELCAADWQNLYYLAHVNRRRAFEVYSNHYLATSGQLYWSDTHQLSVYLDDYHRQLDRRLGAQVRATEMITEVYVPRPQLAEFLERVRRDFRRHAVELIYGTVRLIKHDDESFLAWAKADYACIVFNLHIEHNACGLAKAQADFRRLIARAIDFGGSYYLTYHRWATREQVETCYPQLPEFLRLKQHYDPAETLQSDWYRHYKKMFDA